MLSWKGPIRDIEPKSWPCTGQPKNHTMCLKVFEILLELCQAWCSDHFPGEPVPVLKHPLGEKPSPDIQTKPPLTQIHVVSLSPVTSYESEEISTCPSTSSHEDVEESNEVSPQSSLLQAELTKCPQMLLIRLPLKAIHHLHCLLVATLIP
ncbi:hypothetical protein BTVI_48722 [Pitangus sulphuratus]|nr:hypothetical protein BTVI_48722 [Pitangus sulphuratus]